MKHLISFMFPAIAWSIGLTHGVNE